MPPVLGYELRMSARRRTLSLEVHRDLRIVVRAPARVDRSFIDAWVAERGQWIDRQVERFRRLGREQPVAVRYVTGDRLRFLGRDYRLEVTAAPRPLVRLEGDTLHVALRVGRGEMGGEPVRRALERWYRERAAVIFAELLDRHLPWFAGRGHARPVLTIRRMRSRWGSLSGPGREAGWLDPQVRAARRMTLNLALVHAAPECIEYVVVHELCHLEHRGHGPAFHRLMDQRLPDWHERRRRLEQPQPP